VATWPYFFAMAAHSKPFVVARNRCIAPKERRFERLKAEYAVQEFRDDSQGRYWYVITALELVRAKKAPDPLTQIRRITKG